MASTYGSEDEPAERPAKRRRTSYDADTLGLSSTHTYGNTTINTPYMVVMGNHVQHRGQDPRNHSVTANEDKYNILLKSLLFDRIDFRVNNVRRRYGQHASGCFVTHTFRRGTRVVAWMNTMAFYGSRASPAVASPLS